MKFITSRMASITVRPNLPDGLAKLQDTYPDFATLFEKVKNDKELEFKVKEDGILRLGNRLCIPNKSELKQFIMSEAHNTSYSVHPGYTEMYQDLKIRYWWTGLKKDAAEFIQKCLNYQMIKAEHKLPAGELHSIAFPSWKWQDITMYFMVGLLNTVEGYDSIWVVEDRLTKTARFIQMITYPMSKLAELHMNI